MAGVWGCPPDTIPPLFLREVGSAVLAQVFYISLPEAPGEELLPILAPGMALGKVVCDVVEGTETYAGVSQDISR